jgi:hypothetical protein
MMIASPARVGSCHPLFSPLCLTVLGCRVVSLSLHGDSATSLACLLGGCAMTKNTRLFLIPMIRNQTQNDFFFH